MIMSFIGSIGSVMKGSEALETVYGSNSVTVERQLSEHQLSERTIRVFCQLVYALLE